MTHIPPELAHAAARAGMHDVDDLRILAPAQLDRDPAVVIADLKAQRPNLFRKHAKDMSPQERVAAIADAKTNPRPAPARRVQAEPSAPPRSASVMLLEERAAFLREHAKKFPSEMQFTSLPRKSPWRA